MSDEKTVVNVNIEMELDPDARGKNIKVNPTTARAGKICKIRFNSSRAFSIQFKGISPLEQAYIQSNGKEPIDVNVHAAAQPGVYSYVCALYDEGKIHLDSACPSIIIDW